MARPKPAQILVVDDDRSTQRVLADALKKQGFDVTVERDGEWAVQTFEKKTFDAVILDLLLPAVSGYDVAAQLRESELEEVAHGRKLTAPQRTLLRDRLTQEKYQRLLTELLKSLRERVTVRILDPLDDGGSTVASGKGG